MATITLSGTKSVWNASVDAVISTEDVTLELVVSGDSTGFEYKIKDNIPNSLDHIEIYNPDIYQSSFSDGEPFSQGYHLRFGTFHWTQGGVAQTTTVLAYTNSVTKSQYIFEIGGDAFPTFATAAAYGNFLDSIYSSATASTGPYARKVLIEFAGIPGVSIDNDDIIYGSNDSDDNGAGAAFGYGMGPLIGGTGNDRIFGLGGFDNIQGGDGNDYLDGGTGNDRMHGGDGTDELIGGLGNDWLYGDAGKDVLNGGDGDDTIYGGTENDNLTGGLGNDYLVGGSGADTMIGGEGDDRFYGGSGNDVINGGNGTDQISFAYALGAIQVYLNLGKTRGSDGYDRLSGIEDVIGGHFGDRIIGNTDTNRIEGKGGHDLIKTKGGDDYVNGGDGNDKIIGASGNETFDGGNGADILIGNAGIDVLRGEQGNDFLYGGRDSDTLFGGDGTDVLRGNLGNDTLNGDQGNDRLYGGGNNDVLNGNSGKDSLYGENGNDILNGGEGYDSMTGGAGLDTFIFSSSTSANYDRVKDFTNGEDKLDLSDFGFGAFTDVLAVTTDIGGTLKLKLAPGNVLFLENFALADFDASDVII